MWLRTKDGFKDYITNYGRKVEYRCIVSATLARNSVAAKIAAIFSINIDLN